MTTATSHTGETEEQLVAFTVAGESYGVNIAAVNTIIRLAEITHVPHAPAYVRGVINLRGVIVPVVDVRVRFGLPATDADKATRVMVVENRNMLIGLLVDAVTETLRLPLAAIEPLSPFITSTDARYLRGVGKLGERLIILLALDEVLRHDDETALRTPDFAVASVV